MMSLHRFICVLLFFFCFTVQPLFSSQREEVDRPLHIGPQFPFEYLRTVFEPDAAWTLNSGKFLASISTTHMNTFVFSNNSNKSNNPGGDPSIFTGKGEGYSFYIDGEAFWRNYRLNIGLTGSLELQLTVRTIQFSSGNLDDTIENFHEAFRLGNQGRENTQQDQLEVYIWDNKQQKLVFQFTSPGNSYQTQSSTIGFKYSLISDEDQAVSLRVSSNFQQAVFQDLEAGSGSTTISELNETANSYNLSLNFSRKFAWLSLHLAVAETLMDSPVFERGKKEQFYYFLGLNFCVSDWFDLTLQGLIYTSTLPDDENSNIGENIHEVTMGVRFRFSEEAALEFAFIENQSQGPHNIDIALYSSLMMIF